MVRVAASATVALIAALTPVRASEAEEMPPAAARIQPELAPIDLANPDAEWASLFESLAGKQPLRSTFTETRRFSFKKDVVRLHGEMRFARERGLSLRYTGRQARALIVDDEGIVLRDRQGRSRNIRGDRGGGDPAPVALLPILGFDLPRIGEHFNVRGARTGDLWWLEFAPREDKEARDLRVGPIQVTGEGEAVTRIAFKHASGQLVQIQIDSTETQVVFSDEELKRWFR